MGLLLPLALPVLTRALLHRAQCVSNCTIPPSKLCGPFQGQLFIWYHIQESIENLPQPSQNFLYFLGTQAFAIPLLPLSSILVAYTVALANSYGRFISELKRQIEREAQNKVFLAQRALVLSSANEVF